MKWIDGNDNDVVGQMGFLVRIANPVKRSERWELRDRPPTTNQSFQPRPRGWCGSNNDNSVTGEGVWRVTKIAKNGRVQIEEVEDRGELEAFLEEYGYPELLEQCLPG